MTTLQAITYRGRTVAAQLADTTVAIDVPDVALSAADELFEPLG